MTDLRTPVPFGQTGLQVCRLGIGSSFTRDPAIIEEAVDQGVNYLYWGSIRRPAFGRAIKNVARRNREGVVLTVQSYTRVAALLAPSIELALRRAGVDYFDFLLLGMWNKPPGRGLMDAAQRLVEKGRVHHLMMSTHNLLVRARIAAMPPPMVNWRTRKNREAMAKRTSAIVMGGKSSNATLIIGKARAQIKMVVITIDRFVEFITELLGLSAMAE